MAEPKPVTVQIEVDWDSIIDHEYRQVGEDDYANTRVTLADRVADLVAEKIAGRVLAELKQSYGFDADKIAAQAAETAAYDLFNKALEKVTQPSDVFGQPKGEPKTVAELLSDKIESWLQQPSSTSRDSYGGYSGVRKTNLEQVVTNVIDQDMRALIDKQVKQAKEKVLAALQAESSRLITGAVADILKKRSLEA